MSFSSYAATAHLQTVSIFSWLKRYFMELFLKHHCHNIGQAVFIRLGLFPFPVTRDITEKMNKPKQKEMKKPKQKEMNKQGSFKYSFYLDVIGDFIPRKQNYSSSKYSGVTSVPCSHLPHPFFPCPHAQH